MLRYNYDAKALRYRQPSGRFVSKKQIDAALDKYRAVQSGEMRDVAQQYINKTISRRDAEMAIAKNIKNLWNTELVAGKGGVNMVAANDWLVVARSLKKQYYSGIDKNGRNYGLRKLLDSFEQGKVSPNKLLNSMNSYAKASKEAYWIANEVVMNKSNEYNFMERILGGSVHCDDCIRYQAMGIQPIGTLPLPTVDCACTYNCRCSVKYYKDNVA